MQLYLEDKLYSQFSISLHILISDLRHIAELEAPEVEFVELSEDQQEYEEVIVVAPEVERSAEEANIFCGPRKIPEHLNLLFSEFFIICPNY